MRLTWVRHGTSLLLRPNEIRSGHPGPDLSPEGLEQAAALVEALAEEQFDALYVSGLPRTTQTATPLATARALELVALDGLNEVFAGDLDDSRWDIALKDDAQSTQDYFEVLLAWIGGDLDARMPGADNGHEFLARVDAAVESILASGAQHPLVVSHGGTIWVWVALRCRNADPTFLAERLLPNAGVVVVEGSPDDGWELVSWAGEAAPATA